MLSSNALETLLERLDKLDGQAGDGQNGESTDQPEPEKDLEARIQRAKLLPAGTIPSLYDLVTTHNKSLPIHKLPLELFTEIIKSILPPFDPVVEEDYFKSLHTLAQVSSQWAHIIKGHPPLWAVANGSDSSNILNRALIKSNSTPLSVQWDCTGEICGTVPQLSSSTFWAATCSHLHRWKSALIVVNNAEEFQTLQQLVPLTEHCAAPSLKHFMLLIGRDEDEGEFDMCIEHQRTRIDLFDGNAPRLERLILGNASIRDWRPDVFSNLRILMITSVAPPGPTVHQMLEVLRRCSDSLILLALHDFDLGDGYSYIDGGGASSEPDPIVLTRLEVLSLISLAMRPTTDLLNNIQTPRGIAYKCTPNWPADDRQFFSAIQSHIVPAFASHKERRRLRWKAPARPSKQVFRASRGTIKYAVFDPHDAPDFLIQVGKVSVGDVFQWIADDPSEEIRDEAAGISDDDSSRSKPERFEATVRKVYTEAAVESAIRALCRLKDATSLRLANVGGYGSVDAILKSLASPWPTENGSEAWLCPKVTDLTLENCPLGEAGRGTLIAIAKARCSDLWTPGQPQRLKNLRIKRADKDEKTLMELSRALGVHAVSWTDGQPSEPPDSDSESDSDDDFGDDFEYAMTV